MPATRAPLNDDPLAHALALAACGLRVLPIRPGGKHPPMQSWQHAASTDAEVIRKWWTGLYRDHGVGTAMGRQPDGRWLFALDVDEHDPAASGSDTLAELEAAHGPLPETVRSITGAGGAHLIFDAGDVEVTNGAAVGPGLDVRGGGGQIVVAPTVHPNGRTYAWEDGRAPWDYWIVRAPAWLLELVKPPELALPPSSPRVRNTLDENTPADQLRNRWDWSTELTRRGWLLHHVEGDNTHWTRPGKDRRAGSSGVLHGTDGPFVVFTTDASVAPMWKAGRIGNGCVSLSPLAYVAAYDHAGDLSAAGRALRAVQTPETAVTDETEPESDGLPVPIDWDALFARENDVDWLVEDVWPAGRQLHIFAARKTGKSLVMLWIAACLATGRDPFSGTPRQRVIVAYLDYEMSEDDLLERVEEMGFTPDDLRGWLIYYLWPMLPALDTDNGGRELMRMIERDHAVAVVLDTVSRVVEGEENSADTFRAFFMFTGSRLKRTGISLARLDHEGHLAGRSRGSSAKADDVDILWQLKLTEDGLALVKSGARMSWIPDVVNLARIDPLGFRRSGTDSMWPAGTKAKADELDKADVPIDATQRKAQAMLKALGIAAGKTAVLSKALSYRRQQAGITPGITHTFDPSESTGNQSQTTDLPGGITPGITGITGGGQRGGSPPFLGGESPDPIPDPRDEIF